MFKEGYLYSTLDSKHQRTNYGCVFRLAPGCWVMWGYWKLWKRPVGLSGNFTVSRNYQLALPGDRWSCPAAGAGCQAFISGNHEYFKLFAGESKVTNWCQRNRPTDFVATNWTVLLSSGLLVIFFLWSQEADPGILWTCINNAVAETQSTSIILDLSKTSKRLSMSI